ncbi:MAG: site-2 protease family protein [Phycisphaerae bacterium]|nr:site-2 protease family protein [Phycisphaerae bacterium]
MIWTDGQGREWHIEAGPELITLKAGDQILHIERGVWERDVHLSCVGRDLIARFYGEHVEVGFLVPQEQADEFLSRAKLSRPGDAVDLPIAAPLPQPQRKDLLWPKVTHSSVWALICSAFAFIPLFGLLFGMAALVLIVVFHRRARQAAALAHARTMCRAALILTIGGIGISLLAMFCFVTEAGPAEAQAYTAPAQGMGSYGTIAAAIVVVLVSLSIHECGHAISAWWCGDDLARSLGRVTLNPFAHIDLFGTIILPLILATSGAPVFGYAKPVPVRLTHLSRYRRAHILISLAGPGTNLFLSAVALALLLLMGCLLVLLAPHAVVIGFSSLFSQVVITGIAGGQLLSAVALVLKLVFMINLFLAFFNLIPIPPLDGSWVLEHLFPDTLGRFYAVIRPFGFILFLLMFWAGLIRYLLFPALWLILFGYEVVSACTGL